MTSIGKFLSVIIPYALLISFLCSSCAFVEKVGNFEPVTPNGWNEYQPKYDKKRYYFSAQNLIFEIYPIFAALEPCTVGLFLPVVPVGNCSDTKFTAEQPLMVEIKILSEEEINIDTYENFNPTVTTTHATYTPVPPGQKLFLEHGLSVTATKPHVFRNENKVNWYDRKISYEYTFRFYYIVPEENLKEFVLEFPEKISCTILPALTFTYNQEVRKGIVLHMGP